MPFESKAQRRYLHSQHPDVAAKFEAHTEKGARLPERKGKRSTRDHCKPGRGRSRSR